MKFDAVKLADECASVQGLCHEDPAIFLRISYVDVRHNFEKKIVNCSQIWDTHIAYNLKLRFRSDVHGLIRR
jgi:hypothetical protein